MSSPHELPTPRLGQRPRKLTIYPGVGGEIPPCCLSHLLPFWQVCVAVAEREPVDSPITAPLLWVLLWTEYGFCMRDHAKATPDSRDDARIAAAARRLRGYIRTAGSLDRALVLHRLRPLESFLDHFDPADIVDTSRPAKQYVRNVKDTLAWACQTTPWVSPPKTRRKGCGKPLERDFVAWLHRTIFGPCRSSGPQASPRPAGAAPPEVSP